ncbi:protein TMEPAI-like isoform X2 [Gouania willdenowi]|uniref:Protein TMEPAI-like n=1 Tax=Gouania willdenowi TaxID=441366 RepID=A0A8C5E3K9_GOUWI|nr:protein TMEPAI-like isoform X2 [Gouania willdenowi]
MLNLMGVLNATAANVSCTCNCKRLSSLQTMEITQLEFVQILVIVVVMMVMVVVITCVLNHYRLSARSILSRHAPTPRRHLPLANHQVYNPRASDRGLHTSYLQREPQHSQSHLPLQSQRFQHTYGLGRFQPTYPYLPQSLIDLPPTISLSDGEEPPPYQGPCTLQLRDPEQQMELNRESVRAPPNRTVFDSHRLGPDNSCLRASLQAPPPSSQSGIRVLEAQEASTRQQKQRCGKDGFPPAYSEVISHYYHHTVSASSGSSLIHGLLQPQQRTCVDNRNTTNTKEKPHKPQHV